MARRKQPVQVYSNCAKLFTSDLPFCMQLIVTKLSEIEVIKFITLSSGYVKATCTLSSETEENIIIYAQNKWPKILLKSTLIWCSFTDFTKSLKAITLSAHTLIFQLRQRNYHQVVLQGCRSL